MILIKRIKKYILEKIPSINKKCFRWFLLLRIKRDKIKKKFIKIKNFFIDIINFFIDIINFFFILINKFYRIDKNKKFVLRSKNNNKILIILLKILLLFLNFFKILIKFLKSKIFYTMVL